MEPKDKTQTFDAIKMMRDIRDKISEETQNMTLEHLKTIGRLPSFIRGDL